jgi:hypothetical protein
VWIVRSLHGSTVCCVSAEFCYHGFQGEVRWKVKNGKVGGIYCTGWEAGGDRCDGNLTCLRPVLFIIFVCLYKVVTFGIALV